MTSPFMMSNHRSASILDRLNLKVLPDGTSLRSDNGFWDELAKDAAAHIEQQNQIIASQRDTIEELRNRLAELYKGAPTENAEESSGARF